MDQTQFINSYINNLAEQLKASTLDNIMVKTQLGIANETIETLNAKIAELEKSSGSKKSKPEWEESTFTKEK